MSDTTNETLHVRAGLLHTVPALAGTFHEMITEARPDTDLVHVVDPELLATAIRAGVTEEVSAQVAAHIRHLVSAGAGAVLVTCSSIGEAVDAAARQLDVPVLRVDQTMASEAVAAAGSGGKVAVLATLQATLGPTGRLIQREVEAASAQIEVRASVLTEAAAARAAGDSTAHDRIIAEAVSEAADWADVVVLAQASMARATAGLNLAVPVLTSPAGGVASLVAALSERHL